MILGRCGEAIRAFSYVIEIIYIFQFFLEHLLRIGPAIGELQHSESPAARRQ